MSTFRRRFYPISSITEDISSDNMIIWYDCQERGTDDTKWYPRHQILDDGFTATNFTQTLDNGAFFEQENGPMISIQPASSSYAGAAVGAITTKNIWTQVSQTTNFSYEIVIKIIESDFHYTSNYNWSECLFGQTFTSGKGYYRYGIFLNPSTMQLLYNVYNPDKNGWEYIVISSEILYNTTYVLTFVKEGGTFSTYINGQLNYVATVPENNYAPNTRYNPLTLSSYDHTSQYAADSAIYSFRAFNKALSSSEVRQSYYFLRNKYNLSLRKDLSNIYNINTSYYTSTSETTITIPTGAEYMDIFLIGGGGGGGAWYTWQYNAETPGLGGHCFCKRMISVKNLSSFTYSCGLGGNKASDHTPKIISATQGGTTLLTINGTTYSAEGGQPGVNSASQSEVSYNYNYDCIYKLFAKYATHQNEYSNLYLTQYGVEGDYMMGLKTLIIDSTNNTSYWVTPLNYWTNGLAKYYLSLWPNGVHESGAVTVETPIYGIPEFFEYGNPTHAAQGACANYIRNTTTYGPKGESVTSYHYGFIRYSGSGYGGGGYAGSYSTNDIRYGGNGTQGIVVIRWYIRK